MGIMIISGSEGKKVTEKMSLCCWVRTDGKYESVLNTGIQEAVSLECCPNLGTGGPKSAAKKMGQKCCSWIIDEI